MSFLPAVQAIVPASDRAWCFAFHEGRLMVPATEGHSLSPQPLPLFEPVMATRHYLGRLDEMDCWAMTLSAPPEGWQGLALRAAMMQFSPVLIGLASRAAQVLEWDRAHRFCGVCGTATELLPHERARRCPHCGQVAYPRLSPAMMALVWRDRELLLARAPHFAPGMFSALAGFVESGESLEDCVVREVAEEVGVRVKNLRYYGSQSWPFPHSLMVAYTAEWDGGEIVRQPAEIEEAAWYSIDALPGIPPRFSIAGHLIRDTVEALREGAPGFPLFSPAR